MLIDWKYLDTKSLAPRFPFGYGLSYTNFLYSGVEVRAAFLPDDEMEVSTNEIFEATAELPGVSLYDNVLEVSVIIRNIGSREAAEVVQLYVSFPSGSGMTAAHLLRGFRKIVIGPSQQKK